jgi:hypothetical protein
MNTVSVQSGTPNRSRDRFRPVAPPRIIENAYSEDQHRRLLEVVRSQGPWPLVLAHHFKTPEEVLATGGSMTLPEGFKPTWDMVLSPVFRGYLAHEGVCLFREIEDCYYNSNFLDLVRGYWGAQYAEPETMLFNIQGACPVGGPPHLDGTVFRGMTMDNTPLWLLMSMAKSGLFHRWQAKKGQVIAWYYNGTIGGGFNCWPDGPHGQPMQIEAPMWGRAVVVENEMMLHHGQACGPVSMRKPVGLDIVSRFGADPDNADAWQITTGDKVIQHVPPREMRFLVHWGARLFMDYNELKITMDHTDDITIEQALNILIADLHQRGVEFEEPSDPLNDRRFIGLLAQVHDHGLPDIIPPDADEARLTA